MSVALVDDIRQLGANVRNALGPMLDYHYQSLNAWELVVADVAAGRQFTVQNAVTGLVADQTQIASRVPRYLEGYLIPATFQQIISSFEAFFFDLLGLWLTAHPGSLYRRQVDLETILTAGDNSAILRGVIERELNDLKYRRIADWFDFLRKLVSIPGPSDDEAVALAEAKASRDILVHNKGVVNAVYVAKSGKTARYSAGDLLELPDPYFRATAELIDKVIANLTATVAAKV
jgi:hypothetical protein